MNDTSFATVESVKYFPYDAKQSQANYESGYTLLQSDNHFWRHIQWVTGYVNSQCYINLIVYLNISSENNGFVEVH